MKYFFTILQFILFLNLLYSQSSQQIIGQFPSMDGGFEGQNVGTLSAVSTIGGSDVRTDWTNQGGSPTNSATISSTGGRSGPKYVTFSFTSTGSHRRLQSPTTTGISSSTTYIVQFYYRSNGGSTLDIRGGVSQSGTLQSVYASYDVDANVSSWTKYAKTVTTNGTAAANGIGIVSVLPDEVGGFDIDDFCIYQGSAVDNTAPDPPINPVVAQTSNYGELQVSWTPPTSGTDGGGYLVIRRTSSGSPTPPNINGIYAIGNTIGDGVVAYIGTSTSFTDEGLNPSNTYYYTVYTVDKAFNYSSGVTSDGENPLPVHLKNFNVKLISEKNIELIWSTATETQNYGWEIERSQIDKSTNRPSAWQVIGFVKGSGNSNSPKEYSFIDNTAIYGEYAYRLKQIDIDGTTSYSDELRIFVGTKPEVYDLKAYPNPFNPSTTIRFELPEAGNVRLEVYDVLGRLVGVIMDEYLEEGIYQKEFDGSKLTSGIYLSVLNVNGQKIVKKMQLIK